MRPRTLTLALASFLTLGLVLCDQALAGRGGGGRGGGFRGGGGGYRGGMGGGMARPSYGRSPSFNMPSRSMGYRPQFNSGMARPNTGMARPNTGFRPGSTGSGFGGNRYGLGERPNVGRVGNEFGNRGNFGNEFGNRGNFGNEFGNRANIGNEFGNRANIGNNVGNRANIGNDVGNRANIGNNVGNRANIGNEIGNRANIGNNVGNRTNIGNNVGNRTNIGNNVGNRTNIGNNTFNNVNVNRPLYGSGIGDGNRWAGRGPYQGYHRGWVNGYWHGYHDGNWNRWWGGGWGWGGWGLGAWGFGSWLYNWGYAPYVNPYVVEQPVVVQQPVVVSTPAFDYSQPIDTVAAAPDPQQADPAVQTFDQARAAFKQGDYDQALSLTNQALATLPNDATLHEFLALVLFAQGNYDKAAEVLYAVLSVGPGWDWTTMSGLYPNAETYTKQLRALETYRKQHPDSAAAHFVLAYQYLTEGFSDAAAKELKEVVRLQPSDRLAPQLLTQLTGGPPKESADPNAPPAPPTPPSDPTQGPSPASLDALAGSWTASPAKDSTVTVTFKDKGAFTWAFTQKGQTRQFDGEATYGNGLLTLAQPGGAVMVGQVTSEGDDGFRFRLAGGGPADPGLDFKKATQ